MSNATVLTTTERRAAWSLAAIFAFRMMGLFMLLPVMALYGQHLEGYSPQTVGLAIGIYGLVQGFAMIPLGRLSDRYGRKPLIIFGLILFASGAVVAALSSHIYGVIAGRALQGAGAIAGVVLALAADLTAEQRRSKVMAVIGISIGASFLFAFALGPFLAASAGLKAVFWATGGLALCGLVLTVWVVPAEPRHTVRGGGQSWTVLFGLLKAGQLTRLASGIFILHMVMTAFFVTIPLQLVQLGAKADQHGQIYLPVMVVGAVLMMPFLRMAERRGWHKPVMLVAVSVLAFAIFLTGIKGSLALMLVALVLFFTAFNWLEASLPSWVSRVVPAHDKGTAMGFYTSAQFFGAFFGGAGAGFLQAQWGLQAVLVAAVAACCVWLVLLIGLKALPRWADVTLTADDPETLSQWMEKLQALEGVNEIVMLPDGRALQVTYDQRRVGQDQFQKLTE